MSEKTVLTIAGQVGTDPRIKETAKGNVLDFSVFVPSAYGEGSKNTFFQISCWNEGLIAWAKAELYKGASVAVEGMYSVWNKDGRDYPQISAVKIGLVEWGTRSKRTYDAPVAKPQPREELPF